MLAPKLRLFLDSHLSLIINIQSIANLITFDTQLLITSFTLPSPSLLTALPTFILAPMVYSPPVHQILTPPLKILQWLPSHWEQKPKEALSIWPLLPSCLPPAPGSLASLLLLTCLAAFLPWPPRSQCSSSACPFLAAFLAELLTALSSVQRGAFIEVRTLVCSVHYCIPAPGMAPGTKTCSAAMWNK